MSNKWTIREASPDDPRAIAQLHSKVYREVYHRDYDPGSMWESELPLGGDGGTWPHNNVLYRFPQLACCAIR